MIPQAAEVRLTPEDRAVLEARVRAPTTEQRDVFRARIILLADEGRSTRSIARTGDRHHPLGEWVACVSLRPLAVDAASRRLRVETHRGCDIARRVGVHAAPAAVASRHRRRRWPPCGACCLGGGPQLECLPALLLSSAVWRERPALRQGHWLLSLCAAFLYCH